MARPPLPQEDRRSYKLCFYVTEAEADALYSRARREGRDLALIVREYLAPLLRSSESETTTPSVASRHALP